MLLKSAYVPLVFLAGLVSALVSRFGRLRDLRRPLSRYGAVTSVVAALMAAKLAGAYAINGTTNANTGENLLRFLNQDPQLVLSLPDSDPDVRLLKRDYATQRESLYADRHYSGVWAPEFNRAMLKVYPMVVTRQPHRGLLVALKGYYRQCRDNLAYCYPEESNHQVLAQSRYPLLVLERTINRLLFNPWVSVPWTTLSLLAATVLAFSNVDREQHLPLLLVLGFIGFTLAVTTLAFAGTFGSDNCRMRLSYEAPFLAVECMVAQQIVARVASYTRSSATG